MDEEKKGIVTDMNDRERKRFAEIFRGLAKTAAEAAEALDASDDTKASVMAMILSMQASSLKEFHEIILKGVEKMKEEKQSAEWPETVTT